MSIHLFLRVIRIDCEISKENQDYVSRAPFCCSRSDSIKLTNPSIWNSAIGSAASGKRNGRLSGIALWTITIDSTKFAKSFVVASSEWMPKVLKMSEKNRGSFSSVSYTHL